MKVRNNVEINDREEILTVNKLGELETMVVYTASPFIQELLKRLRKNKF